MARRKTNIKIPEYVRRRIESYANMSILVKELQDKARNPELAEYFETMHMNAYSVMEYLIEELSIKPVLDKAELQTALDYEEKL